MLKRLSKVRNTRGAALIIALAIMVLVLALVVGILARVSTERTAAGGYASSASARILADTAVQLVQAQIDSATSDGTNVAWSSQPGLIRTFDSAGAPLKSFKLYSAGDMQPSGALNPATEAAALTSWYSSPAVFTDINMPVDTDFDGVPDRWPILDASAVNVVEGFSVKDAPTGKYLGVNNAVPMPVRWLYVLQDGQLVAPSGGGTSATVDGASSDNPIVGRVAFWTDDESCKVNVNTASEGTYWDVPRANNPAEQAFGKFQPVKNEFQAYPGHPATTSLSPVFPDLTRDQIMAITPRIQEGGSENATVDIDHAKAVPLDQDRLYATEDELLFANSRADNVGMTKGVLERSKFFVTTTSRAPEVNLFNLPKIACWPIHETNSADYRTPFDRTIAFCATLNDKSYYFQRKNADSTTEDYDGIPRNRELFKYLRYLTTQPVPGFGGSLETKFGADRDQVLAEMFDYIRCTNLADGNLAQARRYAVGKQENGSSGGYFGYGQVMPIKVEDSSASISARGFGRVPTLTEVGLWLICTADAKNDLSNDPATNRTLYPADATGALTSDTTKNTKQLRVEAALVLESFIPLAGYRGIQPDIEIAVSGLESWSMRGNAAGDTDRPMGFPSLGEQTPGLKGRYLFSINPLATSGGMFPYAGHIGVYATLGKKGIRSRNQGRLPADFAFGKPYNHSGTILNQQYPFVSEPLTVDVDNASPGVVVNTVPIEIKVIQRSSKEVLQTYTVNFPSGPLPAPMLRLEVPTKYKDDPIPNPPPNLQTLGPWTLQADGNGQSNTKGAMPGRFSDEFIQGFTFQSYGAGNVLSDVVRSVVPVYTKNGSRQTADLRILAMKDTISAGDFFKHPLYDESASMYRVVNSFSQQTSSWYYHFSRRPAEYTQVAAKMGKSLANMTESYDQQRHPDTSWPAEDAQKNGDWDNGIVGSIDGPYLNKPDEGVTWTQNGTRIPYFETSQKEDFDSATFFSPNRIIPSPGMFGSLPTGVKRDQHWQTLLFRRQPGHPGYSASAGGFTKDPDYLMLDLFWMPVVEPYALSEPLSTAGKINLNQGIVPFTWLERNTGMHAVLKNEKVISIPNADAPVYKSGGTSNYRRDIKIADTLKQLQFRFDNSDGTGLYAFRSAAEICDLHIIPDDATVSVSSKTSLDNDMAAYWATHALTGDNSRERIYTTVYPRLTTKSNAYTVYVRAQSLKKRPGSDPNVWDDSKDVVTGDYRGSTTLERYIDPNNKSIPDYAINPDISPDLNSFYRWRLRNHRQFAP